MGPTASERQLQMLLLYGQRISEREDWGGALVLAFGAGADIVPVPVSIAGGTTLLLSDDAGMVKAAMRRGELDFVVNSVDEALRVLKNQIRQRKPLGVGLIAPVSSALAEITERGVQPDLVLQGGLPVATEIDIRSNLDRLKQRGAPPRLLSPSRDGERWERSWIALRRKRYYAWQVRTQDLDQLRAAQEQLLAVLPQDEQPRRRWLQRLPRYIRDSLEAGRWVWLSEEEFDALPDSLPISPEERP